MTTNKNISQLPDTTTVNASDFIHTSQGGVDKKIKASDFVGDINGGQPFKPTVKEESTDSRTCTQSDVNAYIRCTSPTLTTVTIPPSSSVTWREGDLINLVKVTIGDVTVVGGVGVVINSSSSGLVLTETRQGGTLIYLGNDEWDFLTGGNASTSVVGLSTCLTVETMIAGTTVEGGLLDYNDLGAQNSIVKVVYNNLTSKAGSAEYIIKTVAQAATDGDVIDGTGAPNYQGKNHTLAGGTHVAVKSETKIPYSSSQQVGAKIINGDPVVISCYGDSTMWGATPGNLGIQDPNAPPSALSAAISALTGFSVTVNNRAVSGTTIRQMLAGTDGSGSTYESKIQTGGVDAGISLVYCNHAINDNTANDIEQYRKDLEEFVTVTRTYGICPVIVTTNPCSSGTGSLYNELQIQRLALFVDVQRSVANEFGADLVDNWYFFNKTANHVALSPDIVGDGVHLTTRAYKQSGYNLTSSLFKFKTLVKEGDSAGVYDSQYFDNLTLNRGVLDQSTRTSGVLIGDKTGAQEGVNQGVIFDSPSKSFGIIGGQWQGACKNELTFFNSGSIATHYNYRQYGTTATLDWNSVVKYSEQVWAGVQIFGLLVNVGDSGLGDTITWGGVTLPPNSYEMVTDGNGVVLDSSGNTLAPNDNVILSYDLTVSKPLIFNDIAGGKVLEIAISGAPGQITHEVFVDGVGVGPVNIGGAASVAGIRDIQVQVSSGAITTLIDGAFAQIALTIPLSNIVIASKFVRSFVSTL